MTKETEKMGIKSTNPDVLAVQGMAWKETQEGTETEAADRPAPPLVAELDDEPPEYVDPNEDPHAERADFFVVDDDTPDRSTPDLLAGLIGRRGRGRPGVLTRAMQALRDGQRLEIPLPWDGEFSATGRLNSRDSERLRSALHSAARRRGDRRIETRIEQRPEGWFMLVQFQRAN